MLSNEQKSGIQQKVKSDLQQHLGDTENVGNTVDDQSTPRNQSYLSNVTEHAKNLISPSDTTHGRECKYPYPDDGESIDREKYATKGQSGYTHRAMVDVVDDKDIAASERRIHEYEQQQDSMNKESTGFFKETPHGSTTDTEKSGFMSKMPFGHRKSKSGADENLNKDYSTTTTGNSNRNYVIPNQEQYSAFETQPNNRKAYQTNANDEYTTIEDDTKLDNIALNNKSTKANYTSDTGLEKTMQNLHTVDDETDYPTDQTIRSGTFGENTHMKVTDDTSDSRFQQSSPPDNAANPSIVTRFKNYIIGTDDTTGGTDVIGIMKNDDSPYKSKLTCPSGQSPQENKKLADYHHKKELQHEISHSGSTGFVMNTQRPSHNTELQHDANDYKPTLISPSGLSPQENKKLANYHHLRELEEEGGNIGNSNRLASVTQKQDVTTDMFADSNPYIMVQNKDDMDYLKSEYSDGLKISEKNSSKLRNDNAGVRDMKQDQNQFAYDSNVGGGSEKDNQSKETPITTKTKDSNYGESKLGGGTISNAYDGYYAGTKSNMDKKQGNGMTGANFNPSKQDQDKSAYAKRVAYNTTSLTNEYVDSSPEANMNYNKNKITGQNKEFKNDRSDVTYGATNTSGAVQDSTYKRNLEDHQHVKEYPNKKDSKFNYGECDQRCIDIKQRNFSGGSELGAADLTAKSGTTDAVGGKFDLDSEGAYKYSNSPETIDSSNNTKTASHAITFEESEKFTSDNKGLNKIKNLFTSKDKKAKKEVEKRNISEHGTVYQQSGQTGDIKNANQSTSSDYNDTGAMGMTSASGVKQHNKLQTKTQGNAGHKNVDYSSSAANTSFNKVSQTNAASHATANTERLPVYDDHINAQQGQRPRRKSLIETIKDAL